MVEFYLIKQAGHPHATEVGAEIHVKGQKFYIDFKQEVYKGIRVGAYPIQKHQSIHPAELIA